VGLQAGPGLHGRLARGQRDPVDVAPGPGGQRPVHGEPDASAVAGVRIEPSSDGARLQRTSLDLEALLRLRLRAGQRGEQALAQHPELQLVEQPVHGLAIPRAHGEVRGHDVERDVPDQLGELTVQQDVREVGAERVARLSLDLVHPVGQRLQRPELPHPLGRGLLADARDAGQVVAGVAAQRGEVRVLLRGEPVAGHDGVGVDPAELRDAARRVQDRDVVADELERVAVAAGDQHPEALGLGLGDQRRDDVVGLEVVDREERDRQRRQHVLDQVDLAAELVRRRRPVRLVLGVALGAERDAGDVEGHRHVCGRLVAHQVDEHRREAVDGVRGLPGAGAEILRGQGEERPVGQRVAVEQEQPALGDGVLDRGGRLLRGAGACGGAHRSVSLEPGTDSS
jgi:hypothetical protein